MAKVPDLESAYAVETPDDNRRFYRDWASTYDNDFVDATSFRFPRLIAKAYVTGNGGWPCLDVGCGTGAIAGHMPEGAELHGIDISPEMLAIARTKGRYAHLIEADLTAPIALADRAYAGLVSSGTFTHGHVGPVALIELARLLRLGSLAIITVKTELYATDGYDTVFAQLVDAGQIEPPTYTEERVYSDPAKAPIGHGDDTGLIVTFRRT